MTGHHEIKVMKVALPLNGETDIRLPEGWKPFSSHLDSSFLVIICRKWHREVEAAVPAASIFPIPVMSTTVTSGDTLSSTGEVGMDLWQPEPKLIHTK